MPLYRGVVCAVSCSALLTRPTPTCTRGFLISDIMRSTEIKEAVCLLSVWAFIGLSIVLIALAWGFIQFPK